MPKPLSLRGRDGGQRELGGGAAAGGRLHLDLHEAERTMERRRLEVDAADAIERDHAGRVAEHAALDHEAAAFDAIREPAPLGDRAARARRERPPAARESRAHPSM